MMDIIKDRKVCDRMATSLATGAFALLGLITAHGFDSIFKQVDETLVIQG